MLAASVAAVSIGALTMPGALAKHGANLQDQKKAAHSAVQGAQKDLDGQSKRLIDAQSSLASAEKELTDATAHLHAVQARLVAARKVDARLQAALAAAHQRLDQATADLQQGQQAVTTQRTAAQRAILSTYTQGSPTLHEVQSLLNGQSLDALTSQEAYGAAVNGLQINSYQALQSAKVMLTVRREDVATATRQVAGQEKRAAAQVVAVQQLRTQAETAKDAVVKLVDTRRADAKEAFEAKQSDARKLAAAKTKEQRIERQILAQAAAQAAHGRARVVPMSGMFYPPVVDTYITSPYGWRINPVMHYWGLHDGDDLHAPCGTPEHAAQSGTVADEYYSDVWGNRLFLNMGTINGHTWVGIYNHIEHYDVHAGQVVTKGQVLALAGTTGWSTGCHLHFTLMRDGVAVNPADYIHFG
jgi:murein DD-endopeptidase MepM/ murein hydrolase activator NlpD